MPIGFMVISAIMLVIIFPQSVSMVANMFVGLLVGIVDVFVMIIDLFGNLIQRK